MSVKTIISTSVAIIATGAMFACVAPFASADSAQTSAVVSSRSFPKASSVKKNLFAESTSTSVDENSKWGGIETLDVPQTESQGEKEAAAAAAAQKAAAAAAAQKAADEAAAAQSAAAAAASRSEQRASIPQVDLGKMTGTGTGAELASFSLKFQGYPYVAGGNTPAGWDCSGFVQYVFSQFGISLPRTSGAQATVGTPVASLADAKPGDILANGTHAAIYIGNGQVMNAMNPVQGTAVSDVSVFGGAGYSIRRVM
ncbi:NlpC/P60 family protein [Bifidobacterium longum]|nr:NlpC/P60 family protein [Bifidobacterium longum]KAB7265356.1 NlpC/P60 family protein [Bifidobacterium longum]KAB7268866.1 NlpC/P60 family protein [Bifidobacterium longum]KAB7271158.1 NlpC/P60 family protein [Bifidobacterium longum]KAB7272322.1 NlpC/P60 family protein [Bifidobacterium longum]